MKRIRLDPEAYEEGACFSLTLSTARRQPCFSDADVVGLCLSALRQSANQYHASVYAYCFMPDHAHLLVSVPPGASLVNFVRHFKQLTSYGFRRLPEHHGESLWQGRFYDHALRRADDLERVAMYIRANPVRAGLVAEPDEYPHSGSLLAEGEALSGSEDPDLHPSPRGSLMDVGEGLQTLAKKKMSRVAYGPSSVRVDRNQ